MARFYFEPNDREPTFEDHQGLERADLDEARQAAAHAARVFIQAEDAQGKPCGCCCVEVTNAADPRAETAVSARVVDHPDT